MLTEYSVFLFISMFTTNIVAQLVCEKSRYRLILSSLKMYSLGQHYAPQEATWIEANNNICRDENICRHSIHEPTLLTFKYSSYCIWRYSKYAWVNFKYFMNIKFWQLHSTCICMVGLYFSYFHLKSQVRLSAKFMDTMKTMDLYCMNT